MQQRFGGGETGDDVARRQRRDALRRLEAHMEEGLRPIRELMAQLKGVPPPDYGTLDVRTAFSCLCFIPKPWPSALSLRVLYP